MPISLSLSLSLSTMPHCTTATPPPPHIHTPPTQQLKLPSSSSCIDTFVIVPSLTVMAVVAKPSYYGGDQPTVTWSVKNSDPGSSYTIFIKIGRAGTSTATWPKLATRPLVGTSGEYTVAIPAGVGGVIQIGPGYFFVAELALDGAVVATGTSETNFRVQGKIQVNSPIQPGTGLHADHFPGHLHGADTVALRWQVSNDDAQGTFARQVFFQVSKGTGAAQEIRATVEPDSDPVYLSEVSLTEATVRIPDSGAIAPPCEEACYAICIAAAVDAQSSSVASEDVTIDAGCSALFSIMALIVVTAPSDETTLSIKGGAAVSVEWSNHNLNGNVIVVICPAEVAASSDDKPNGGNPYDLGVGCTTMDGGTYLAAPFCVRVVLSMFDIFGSPF